MFVRRSPRYDHETEDVCLENTNLIATGTNHETEDVCLENTNLIATGTTTFIRDHPFDHNCPPCVACHLFRTRPLTEAHPP
jgi:hypothetical protein